VQTELSIPIETDFDLITARQEGRRISAQIGFCDSDLTVIATAISGVARNILEYAGHGRVEIRLVERNGSAGVSVSAIDEAPGIADLRLAMEDGYSTSGGLGLGLPGARRLMDEFEIQSELGKGTTVVMRKWMR
jgi:serine/threonine-protein kinase RsbT